MNALELERYLYEHIPLSKAMGVAVREAGVERVTLFAPLAPNINHRETVFGGSASALALLAAWALLYLRLQAEHIDNRLVVQRNTMHYARPILGDFTATAAAPADWSSFLRLLRRKARARIAVAVELRSGGDVVGSMEGDFVALATRRK